MCDICENATLNGPESQVFYLYVVSAGLGHCLSQHLYYSCVSNIKAITSFLQNQGAVYASTEIKNLVISLGMSTYQTGIAHPSGASIINKFPLLLLSLSPCLSPSQLSVERCICRGVLSGQSSPERVPRGDL